MSSCIPPDSMPNQISNSDVRQLYEGVARAPFVKGVREFELWDRDVIIAFDVETNLGRKNVLAVSTPADVEYIIGSLHIRTKFPNVPTPTDGMLLRLQEFAVFMHYVRAEAEIGVEVQSRKISSPLARPTITVMFRP